MPRIYVQFSGLEQVGTGCKTVSSRVDAIKSDFQSTIRALDWDVRFADDINSTATQISRKLEQQSRALKAYQSFIEVAKSEYDKLNNYKQPSPAENRSIQFDFGWKDILKSFGSAGSVFGIAYGAFTAKNSLDWGKVGVDLTKTIFSISKDYNNYNKIGRAIGTTNSKGYFWRNFFGFNKVGYASTASSPSARFYNNLHNTTSPYKLSGIFDSFTGKNGVVSAAASWAGVALSTAKNAFSNLEEQEQSNGTMSTGRVVAETITETAIDTVATAAGSVIVGAAIATVTGAVAAPVVVAATTGLAIAGINAGVEALTGQPATEWASDFILDTASTVGSMVADGAKTVASWFNKLSFA